MNTTSIYDQTTGGKPGGGDPAFGVAYLRVAGAPSHRRYWQECHQEGIEKQRQIIARAATRDRVCIVAEFIDDNDDPVPSHRIGFNALRQFLDDNRLDLVYMADPAVLTTDAEVRAYWLAYFDLRQNRSARFAREE